MWGNWLRQGLGRFRRWKAIFEQQWGLRTYANTDVTVDIDLAWVNCFEMRLTDALSADDVWFQVQAEVAAHMHLAVDEVAFDFISEHSITDAQVLYRVFAVPTALLASLTSVLVGMGLRLSRLGVCDPQGMGAIMPSQINFLPYRQMRLQQNKRQFAWRCSAALVCGMVFALAGQSAWTFWLSQTGVDQAARLRAQQTLNDSQVQFNVLQHMLQQQTQLQIQQQSRHQQQQQTLQWQAVLHDNLSAIWYAQLTQDGSAWRLTGQALVQADVQRLQTQLSGLTIWQTPPAMKQWTAVPPEPQVRMAVWQFELAGVLAVVTPPPSVVRATP
jgi:Tfp pilus assembly protein PilN